MTSFKRLHLHRETLQMLSPQSASLVQGAADTTGTTCVQQTNGQATGSITSCGPSRRITCATLK